MAEKLPVTIKKGNSIKEAAITLFLSNPIIKPERFKELVNIPELGGFFQQHQAIGAFTLKLGNIPKDQKSETNFKNDTGFKLLKFENGAPTFVVQGINELDRTFFSFHDLNYSRWINLKNNFDNILKNIKTIQSDIFVNGLSVHYIDEFLWDSSQEFDLSRIMKAEDYLPNNFIKIKGGHLSNTRECETKDGQKLFDRLEVLVNSSIEKVITISHNQTVLTSNLFEYGSVEFDKNIGALLEELHENNKELLRNVLLKEVNELIKLN
ncbi:MAG: TIGR04255 family protein [Bacteroidia bacterium]